MFVYADGDGKDVICNFNGKNDVVYLKGVSELKKDAIEVKGTKVILSLSGKNDVLTLDDPKGRVDFYGENANGELVSLGGTGINLPSGVEYNKNKTAITIASSAENLAPIDLSSGDYPSSVKEIDASEYKGSIVLIGNDQKNVLRAGSGSATLNGSYNATGKKATADILYGGDESDTFVWDSSLGGSDVINKYSWAQGDIISVTGGVKFDKSNFKENGKNIVLQIGSNKLTISDVKDQTIVAVAGNDTVSFNSLPSGVSYGDAKKTLVNIGAAYEGGTIDASTDYSAAVTLDASASTSDVVLIGSKKAKIFKSGAGNTTLVGSTTAEVYTLGSGADTIIYSNGGGKDQVYSFDSEKDAIKLSDTTVAITDFSEKNGDVILTVGKGSITFKSAPRQETITVINKDGSTTSYKTLPENVTYDAKKSVIKTDAKFSGTLAVSELGGLTVKEINASATTSKIIIQGGADATKITASKGGSEITGGAGKDTMVGGAGEDTFNTSGGDDFIDKYTAGKDKIVVTSGSLTDGKLSGSNVELTINGNKLTVKGVKGKAITIVEDGTATDYTFDATNNTLAKIKAAASQLPSAVDDYWFMQSDETNDELGTLIIDSATADDAALASMSDAFDRTARSMQLASTGIIDKKRK